MPESLTIFHHLCTPLFDCVRFSFTIDPEERPDLPRNWKGGNKNKNKKTVGNLLFRGKIYVMSIFSGPIWTPEKFFVGTPGTSKGIKVERGTRPRQKSGHEM